MESEMDKLFALFLIIPLWIGGCAATQTSINASSHNSNVKMKSSILSW
jgi:hypothetical protein